MKKLLLLLLLLPLFGSAQTTLFSENFETGNSLTLVNGTQLNKWFRGTAPTQCSGTGLYIDNGTGATNLYTGTTASTTHAYFDFTFPAGVTSVTLNFTAKARGEASIFGTLYDYLQVYSSPTTFTPAAGTLASGGTLLRNIQGVTTCTGYTSTITGVAGSTRRIIFTWRNDNSTANQPPALIDNITVIYYPPPANNDCTGATSLTVNPSTPCVTSSSGTTISATSSAAGCAGTADDDVWYSFTATATSHIITVTPGTLSDAVFQVYSGTCAALTSLSCIDATAGTAVETTTLTGLTIGTTYRVRVYSYASGSGQGTFTICVTTPAPPTPPVNDACSAATSLPCGTSSLAGTTVNSVSETAPSTCVGTYGVWYTFTGDGSTTTVSAYATMDIGMYIGYGSCGSLTPVACADIYSGLSTESSTFTTTSGVTYYVYVAYYGTGTTTGTFTISRTCFTPPVNDACSGATSLPCGTSSLAGTTVNSVSEAIPGCTFYVGTYGVWYKFTGDGSSTTVSAYSTMDIGMYIGYGSCGSLTSLACVDGWGAPATESSTFTTTSGVTYYVYVAYYDETVTTTGTFTISRTSTITPIVNSPSICPGSTATLTASGATSYAWTAGLSASTGSSVTASPSSTTSYTVTGTSGTCTGTAVSTVTVNPLPTLTVSPISICAGASGTLTVSGASTYSWAPATGLSATTGTSVTANPAATTTYTVTGTSAAGCTSSATVIVTVNPIPVTTVNSPTICEGASATLTAAGATSYAWTTGDLTNPISVTPATTTSYTVTGTSLGCSSTAVATVTVNPLPITTVNSPTICAGAAATLTAAGATSYAWTTGDLTNPISVTPATTTSYTVTGTTSGCSSTAVATVTVNPSPTTTISSTVSGVASTSICAGDSATLTAAGASSYVWSTGDLTNPITVTPATTTAYTVTGTSGSCSTTASVTVTVILPVSSTITITGNAVIIAGTSENYSIAPDPNATSYQWDYRESSTTAWVTGISTTTSATVNWPLTTTDGEVLVTVSNTCRSQSQNLLVFVDGVLPIELLYFNGVAYPTFNLLKWATATEQLSDYFEIQESLDGITWRTAGIKPGAGNSNVLTSYSDSVVFNELAYHYYRLKQVDYDGNFKFYDIITLDNTRDSNSADLNAYHNHNGSIVIMLNTDASQQYTTVLYDAQGNKVKAQDFESVKGGNIFKLDVSNCQLGVYFLQISNGVKQVSKKIFID